MSKPLKPLKSGSAESPVLGAPVVGGPVVGAPVVGGPMVGAQVVVGPVVVGRRRAVLLPLGVGAAALVAAGYVNTVDPNASGHYPTCPFLAVTGWYCPGCGALRAVHALGHADVGTALARNPFAVVAFGYLAITWLLWLRRTVTRRPPRWLAPPWVPYSVLGAIVVFWVLRNLPGWTWLSPA